MILSPLTCSGLAYSGVMTRKAGIVWVNNSSPALRSFAMPKSSSFGSPSCVTRMFDGFRSR